MTSASRSRTAPLEPGLTKKVRGASDSFADGIQGDQEKRILGAPPCPELHERTKDILPQGSSSSPSPSSWRITLKEMVDCAPGATPGPPPPGVVLDMEPVAQQAIQTQDWGTAQRTLEERFHAEIAPLRMRASPLPDHLLRLCRPSRSPSTWASAGDLAAGDESSPTTTPGASGVVPDPGKPPARLLPPQLPTERDRSPGEAIIRVSTSHLVDAAGHTKGRPWIAGGDRSRAGAPLGGCVLQRGGDAEVARAFRQALDLIGDRFQGIHCVHLFSSVQPGMALLLAPRSARRCTPPVQTYQYARHAENGPYHVPAVLVNRPPRPDSGALTPKQVEQAASDRARLVKDMERMEGFAEVSNAWLGAGMARGPAVVLQGASGLSWSLKHLPALHSTPLLKTKVDTRLAPSRTASASPRLTTSGSSMITGWRGSHAGCREDAKRQQALRMLVFHELAHRGPQKLTRTSSGKSAASPGCSRRSTTRRTCGRCSMSTRSRGTTPHAMWRTSQVLHGDGPDRHRDHVGLRR